MALDFGPVEAEPTRAEIEASQQPVVIEFGARWCGYCQAAQPLIASALHDHPRVRRVKIEDGPGRPLGRSFGIKLWPTLVFMQQGKEIARLVRPTDQALIDQALAQLDDES